MTDRTLGTGSGGWRAPSLETWLIAGGAVLLGLAAGWIGTRFPGAFHLEPTPLHGALLVAGSVGVAAVLRRPVLGLVALVAVVYLHLSDVLVRFHDLPSLLQLLTLLLVLAVVLEWREELLEGLCPWSLTVALTGYVLAFLVSTTVARDTALADARTMAAAEGFVIYALVLLLASGRERIRAGAWALTGGGLVLGGVSLFQVATGRFRDSFGGLARVEYAQVYGSVVEPRITGPLGDANFFAQVLVIVVPVALILAWKERSRWLRLTALGAAAVAAAATIYTYSRGGALALGTVVVCSLFAARPSRRRLLLGGVLLLAALLLLPGDFTRRVGTLTQLFPGQEQVIELDSSFQNRILQARVAGRMFADHPLLGVGAGNYTAHYYEYANAIGSSAPEYHLVGGAHYPHNLYLELASETGFLGLITFGAALLLVFGHLRRAEAAYFEDGQELTAGLASAFQIALLGFLVSSLFLHGHFQHYLWILFGLSAALARDAPGRPLAPAEGGRAEP